MKKIIGIVILTVMIMSVTFAVYFSDLSSTHWAYKPISEMAQRGILIGYPDGSFQPERAVTRAEFSKIMVLALNLQGSRSTAFEDVPDSHWAKEYVSIASNYLTPYRNDSNRPIYKPDDSAIREEVCVAMVKACGLEYAEYDLSVLNKFSDYNQITSNLRKYIAIAVEHELMRGHENGTFEPKGYLTRAQICQLVMNAEDVKKKNGDYEGNEGTTSSEPLFNISYDKKYLRVDLGEDWNKYYFTSVTQNDYEAGLKSGIVYTPSQRYLNYTKRTNENGARDSFDFNLTDKETKFIAILKTNFNKTKTITFATPFNISVNGTCSSSYEASELKIKVSGTNSIKSVNAYWDNNKITYASSSDEFEIQVPFTSGNDTFHLVIKDVEGNEYTWHTNVTYKANSSNANTNNNENTNTNTNTNQNDATKEYFKDIVLRKKDLSLDLGEYWNEYKFTKTSDSNRTTYLPYDKVLSYKDNTIAQPNYTNSYYIFDNDEEKITLRISLKSDDTQYKDIELQNPFFITFSDINGNYSTSEVNIIASMKKSYNAINRVEYKIDNGSWATYNDEIDTGSYYRATINVKPYVSDSEYHTLYVRFTDEYGNSKEASKTFIIAKEETVVVQGSLNDIKFNTETLKLDLGEGYSNLRYSCNGQEFIPSSRYLSYNSSSAKPSSNGSTWDSYNFFNGSDSIVLKVYLASDTSMSSNITIKDPFKIVLDDPKIDRNAELDSNQTYIMETKLNKVYNNTIKQVEYRVDNGAWKTINTNLDKSTYWGTTINVSAYQDEKTHKIELRYRDQNDNYGELTRDFKINRTYITLTVNGEPYDSSKIYTASSLTVVAYGNGKLENIEKMYGWWHHAKIAVGYVYGATWTSAVPNSNEYANSEYGLLEVEILAKDGTRYRPHLNVKYKANSSSSSSGGSTSSGGSNSSSSSGGTTGGSTSTTSYVIKVDGNNVTTVSKHIGDAVTISCTGASKIKYQWVSVLNAQEVTVNGASASPVVPTIAVEVAILKATALDSSGKTVAEKTITVNITPKTNTSTGSSSSSSTGSTTTTPTISSIKISPSLKAIAVGETLQYSATFSPSDYPNQGITWSSSNTSIATIDANGKVTAKGVGSVTIKGTSKADPSKSGSTTLTVKKVTLSIKNKTAPYEYSAGESIELSTTPSYSGNIVWLISYGGQQVYVKTGGTTLSVSDFYSMVRASGLIGQPLTLRAYTSRDSSQAIETTIKLK